MIALEIIGVAIGVAILIDNTIEDLRKNDEK